MAARRGQKSVHAAGPDSAERQPEPKPKPHSRKSVRAAHPAKPSKSGVKLGGSRFEGTVTASTPQSSTHQQFLHDMTQKLRASGRRGG